MRKGQKQTEEAKEKIRQARLAKTDDVAFWNNNISLALKKYWRRKKWEAKKQMPNDIPQ